VHLSQKIDGSFTDLQGSFVDDVQLQKISSQL